jgi:WD40 repeat protein
MTHDAGATTVAFSPDGKWVASASEDKTARVWEAATGREVARMTHDDYVYAVAFSPVERGKWVVSAGGDKTARVWEAATGHEVARMTHDGGVYAVAFSPAEPGKWVVSAGGDKTARVWLWRNQDLIDLACSRLTRNLTQEEWKQYLPGEPYRKTCPNLPGD